MLTVAALYQFTSRLFQHCLADDMSLEQAVFKRSFSGHLHLAGYARFQHLILTIRLFQIINKLHRRLDRLLFFMQLIKTP